MLHQLKVRALHAHEVLQRWLLSPLLRRQWRHGPWPAPNERPVEYAFALRCLADTWPKRVLDVGPGVTAWPNIVAAGGFRVTAIDKVRGYWDRNAFNRHHHVVRDDILHPKVQGPFDAVTCISVLEHIPRHQEAVESIFRLLAPGGHFILTCPYDEHRYVENVYDLPEASYGRDYGFVCQMFSRRELEGWMAATGAELVEQEHHRIFSGEKWAAGERLLPPQRTGPDEPHHLSCILLRKPAEAES